jgi:purine-nucleoside phosphorylase
MTEIIDDSFLSYQIIDVRNKTYINFSWANDEILSAAIKTLEQVFSFKSLYMYGKCGSLTPDLKIGQLVAPMQCSNGKKFVDIKNQMLLSNDTKAVNFIHVQSPLVETRTWARTMLSLGCNCVDMELDSVVRSISEKVTKKIIYYISDEPTMGLTLSDRLSMLKQRLDCSKKIIEDLLTDTVEHL